MPSWTTVYRAIVMIATGVILVKGWQAYGPSNEQMKTFATTALEAAWSSMGEDSPQATPSAIDPRHAAPQVVAEASPAAQAQIEAAPQLVPVTDAGGEVPSDVSDMATAAPLAVTDENEVAKLLAHLEQLGVANAQVMPWGSSGGLFRCCCQAKLAETAELARHFEAVAGEPVAAVERVVAKVEAWRTEQQNLLR